MAVKLQIVISWVITYSTYKIKVVCLSEISVTTNMILILTFKFIFICIPLSPEMVTTFDTVNVIKLFIYTQNKLHIQIHTYKHTQVHLFYEDDIQLLLKLQNDSMGLIHHQ